MFEYCGSSSFFSIFGGSTTPNRPIAVSNGFFDSNPNPKKMRGFEPSTFEILFLTPSISIIFFPVNAFLTAAAAIPTKYGFLRRSPPKILFPREYTLRTFCLFFCIPFYYLLLYYYYYICLFY